MAPAPDEGSREMEDHDTHSTGEGGEETPDQGARQGKRGGMEAVIQATAHSVPSVETHKPWTGQEYLPSTGTHSLAAEHTQLLLRAPQ